MMKARPAVRASIAAFALILCARVVAAPPSQALDSVLDPAIGLKELSDAVARGKAVPGDRFFLLTGRIGVVVDRTGEAEGAEYQGESELVGGEWIGLESVRSFRAYLRFTGKRFAGIGDEDSADWIERGTLVVVIGSFAGTVKEYGSDRQVALIDVRRVIPVE